MRIAIAGAGTTGLSCAHILIDSGIPSTSITIIDARAEIGSPAHKPGFLNDADTWLSQLTSWGMTNQAFTNQIDTNTIGLRREWLEKSISLGLAERGAHIFVKTRIISSDSNNSSCRLICTDVGGLLDGKWEGDLIIDALGQPPAAINENTEHGVLQSVSDSHRISIDRTADQVNLEWRGAITSKRMETESPFVFMRGDGTWESWEQGTDVIQNYILEEFIGKFSDFNYACVDISLTRGSALAQAALTHLNVKDNAKE